MKSILTAIGLAGALVVPAAAQNFGPPELVAAAKKEDGWCSIPPTSPKWSRR